MYEVCARALRWRSPTVGWLTLAVVGVLLGGVPTAPVQGQSGATQRLAYSESSRPIACSSDQPEVAGKADQAATLKKSLMIAPRRGGEALYSPDGKSMVTSELAGPGAGAIIHVWDTSTWKERGSIEQGGATIFGHYSDDGRVIISGYRGTIRFTDAKQLTPIVTLDIPNRQSPSYCVAPDRSAIVYVDEKGVVVRRNLPDLFQTDAEQLQAAFDRIGSKFLFALAPGLIVQQMAFTPDRKSLALVTVSLREQFAAFTLRDLSDGHELTSKSVVGRDFARVMFAPDGKTLIGAFSNQQEGSDSTLVFWSTASWEELARTSIAESAPTTLMYSPDGASFTTASRKGAVTFWDANTRQPRGQFTAHDGIVVSIYFSPDGRELATASTTPGEPIKIWDLAAAPASKPRAGN